MKLSLIALLILLTSCNHYRDSSDLKKAFQERSSNRSDTVVVYHSECTDCCELNIIRGHLTIPQDLSPKIKWTYGFIVAGNFPLEFVETNVAGFFPDEDYEYRVVGKVIGVGDDIAIGDVPIFYVESWKRLKLVGK